MQPEPTVKSEERVVTKPLTVGEAFRRLGPVGPMAVIALCMPPLGAIAIFATAPSVAPWLASHGIEAMVLFAVVVAILGGLALLPTYAQAYLAGFAFKLGAGLPTVMAGVLGAASIAYLLGRRASGERAVKLIEENAKARVVYRALLKSTRLKTLLIVTLLRLPPNSPFALTNLLLSSIRVPFATYFVGTLLGLLPRTTAVVVIGAQASELSFEEPRTVWSFAIGLVLTIGVLAIIGKMAQNALAKMTRVEETEASSVVTPAS